MTQEALKLALEALEEAWYHVGTFQPTEKAIDLYDEARTAIKEALAQTQEPVACAECERLKDALKRANGLAEHFERAWYLRGDEIEELQAPPPQRTWVGLTDEEIDKLRSGYESGRIGSFVALAKAIEAKLKDKNT
jgi:hypothetical protein